MTNKSYFYLCISFLILSACKKTDVLEINAEDLKGKEICLYFYSNGKRILNVNRELKILENTLTDTLAIGFGIVAPGQIGKIVDLRSEDGLLYDEVLDLPKTDRLYVNKYKNKAVRGKLKILFSY